jgi:hypothetical protein
MSDNHNMNVDQTLDGLVLVKTTLFLIIINLLLAGIDSVGTIDIYIQLFGHSLIVITALVSLFLNWNNIKKRVKEIRGSKKSGKSK